MFWFGLVIGVAIGAAGYWAYDKYLAKFFTKAKAVVETVEVHVNQQGK